MCGEDNSLKYLIVVAIILLPRLSESVSCGSYKTNTTVQGPPVMTELKSKKTIYQLWRTGKFGSLQCCTSGNPLPTVNWYKNGYQIDLTNYRFRLVDNNQTLWIESLKVADSGLYSCRASNTFGNQSRNFKVTVKSTLDFQKPVVIVKPSSWSAVVSNNVTLSCIVKKSARRPFILWHLNSTSTRPLLRYTGRHFVSTKKMDEEQTWNSNLTIINVTTNDGGVYICVARNGAGSGTAAQDSGVLTVKEPLLIKPGTPTPEKSTWSEQGPVLTTVFSGLFVFVVVAAFTVYWCKKKRTHSPGIVLDDNHLVDQPAELKMLINADGTVAYEAQTANIPLVRSGANEPVDFDLFISYSSQDRDFVKKVLFEELSTTHSVCIDFKDFEAGLYIGDNILNSIFRSRKTLLVVSRNFLGGVWTYFEMQIAQGRLAQGHDVLIPVIIEDISFDELPKPLQYYRQTKTYLEYFNEDVRPHFWERLRSALGPSLRESQDDTPPIPEDGSLADSHAV